MSAAPITSGVHVRATASTNGTDAMLTLQIWPLPQDVLNNLYEHLRDETNKYLVARQIVNGQMTDLTSKGPTQ